MKRAWNASTIIATSVVQPIKSNRQAELSGDEGRHDRNAEDDGDDAQGGEDGSSGLHIAISLYPSLEFHIPHRDRL